MTLRRLTFQVALLTAVIPVVAAAQPARDSAAADRARALLLAALDALGGRDRVAAIPAWLVAGRGRENLSGEGQGLEPGRPTWRPHQESVAVAVRPLAVAWERRTPRNDLSLRWRRFVFTPDSAGYVDWVVNAGGLAPNRVPESRRRGFARRIPHLLLLEASTEPIAAAVRDPARSTDAVVEVVLADSARLELTLGGHPVPLRAAAYRAYMPGAGDVTVRWEWPDWTPDPTLGFVPRGHRILVGGTVFQEVTYSTYVPDSLAARALITVPAAVRGNHSASSAQPPAASPPLPATGEVAPGVRVTSVGGFTLLFVEFRNFVVAFEAPEAARGLEAIPATGGPPRLTSQYLARIRAAVPNKPVRYVVASHHHGDHMGGLRTFAAAGATILVAPGHRAAAAATLTAPHTIAPDDWRGTNPLPIEVVAGSRVLTDGVRRLELINVSVNPHTRENLLAWLPQERILFQGDLFYYAEAEPFPPSGRATMNRFFAEWVERRHLAPRAIYGVHNDGAAPPELLARAMLSAPAASP